VANRAGNTLFVEPALVEGTLYQGFEMAKMIRTAFGRAAFLMFLIAEVHPFDDGNGRVARAAMNAELVSSGQRRILVPTVFRVEYVDALKRLSQEDQPRLFARMLDAAQEFAHDVDFSSMPRAREELDLWNAFEADSNSRLRRRSRPG
jgi:fido (protein-threonine AMPylation protein)